MVNKEEKMEVVNVDSRASFVDWKTFSVVRRCVVDDCETDKDENGEMVVAGFDISSVLVENSLLGVVVLSCGRVGVSVDNCKVVGGLVGF